MALWLTQSITGYYGTSVCSELFSSALSGLADTSYCLRPLLPAGQDIVVVVAADAVVGVVGSVCPPPPGTWSLSD